MRPPIAQLHRRGDGDVQPVVGCPLDADRDLESPSPATVASGCAASEAIDSDSCSIHRKN